MIWHKWDACDNNYFFNNTTRCAFGWELCIYVRDKSIFWMESPISTSLQYYYYHAMMIFANETNKERVKKNQCLPFPHQFLPVSRFIIHQLQNWHQIWCIVKSYSCFFIRCIMQTMEGFIPCIHFNKPRYSSTEERKLTSTYILTTIHILHVRQKVLILINFIYKYNKITNKLNRLFLNNSVTKYRISSISKDCGD